MVEKVPTMVQGLDEIINGGIPKGRIVLVAGTPGTGKSILCFQMLYNNALKGKKCLFLNLEQNAGRIEGQMDQFGMNLKKTGNNLKVVSLDIDSPDTLINILKEFKENKNKYDMVCLDSLDSISSNPTSTEELSKYDVIRIIDEMVPIPQDINNINRLKLKKIFKAIGDSQITTLLTSERVENSPGITRDSISEFLSDGIILLDLKEIAKKTIRSLKVRKMRETKHSTDSFLLEITDKGIVVRKENVFEGEKISGIIR